MPLKINPGKINTTKGMKDPLTLRRVDGAVNNDNEFTEWVEFWDGTELVHRSVEVSLKQFPNAIPKVETL